MVTTMKWLSMMALLLAMYEYRSASYFTVAAAFVVCAGAVVVLAQAAGKGKYLWAGVFLGIAVLVNPFIPLPFSRALFLAVDGTSLVMFLISLLVLKSTPRLTIASIADPGLRSESL